MAESEKVMKRGFVAIALFAGMGSLGLVLSLGSILGDLFSGRHGREAGRFKETLQLVSKHFVRSDEVDTGELTADAIDHLLQSLDENSQYLPRREAREFEIDTEQRYGGIGIEVEWSEGWVTVVAPIEGSPGELAGLLPGDRIIRIEGESMKGARYRDVVERLRGRPGSKVAFSIVRPVSGREMDLEVVRSVIQVDSVRQAHMIEPGIGYLRITKFGLKTGHEFREALDELDRHGLEGLILDLRNNAGGVLRSAVEVAGEFFEPGETVVYTEGKETSANKHYRASSPKREGDFPLAILVNKGSASASEIVAGALQDIGRAKLVGMRTFGKGSVQTIFQYDNGDAMRLTTAMYFTPAGRVIHKRGLEPDLEIAQTDEEMRKLMLQRRYLEILGDEAFVEQYDFEPILDSQLMGALELLKAESP